MDGGDAGTSGDAGGAAELGPAADFAFYGAGAGGRDLGLAWAETGRVKVLVPGGGGPGAWSWDGKWLALHGGGGVHVRSTRFRDDRSFWFEFPSDRLWWSPTTTKFLALEVDPEGDAFVLRVAGTDAPEPVVIPRSPLTYPDHVVDAMWSPTGERLLYGTTHELHTVDADGENDVLLAPAETLTRPTWGAAFWSPTGQLIGFPGATGLRLVDADSAKVVVTWKRFSKGAYRFSPDGRWVAGSQRNSTGESSALWRVEDGKEIDLGSTSGGSWAPKGLVYAAYSAGGFVEILNPDTNSSRRVATSHFSDLVWAPDGHSFALVDHMEEGRRVLETARIVIVRSEGSVVAERTATHPILVGFSPDGRSLLYQAEAAIFAWTPGEPPVEVSETGEESPLGWLPSTPHLLLCTPGRLVSIRADASDLHVWATGHSRVWSASLGYIECGP